MCADTLGDVLWGMSYESRKIKVRVQSNNCGRTVSLRRSNGVPASSEQFSEGLINEVLQACAIPPTARQFLAIFENHNVLPTVNRL
jgi:hypothetical protein